MLLFNSVLLCALCLILYGMWWRSGRRGCRTCPWCVMIRLKSVSSWCENYLISLNWLDECVNFYWSRWNSWYAAVRRAGRRRRWSSGWPTRAKRNCSSDLIGSQNSQLRQLAAFTQYALTEPCTTPLTLSQPSHASNALTRHLFMGSFLCPFSSFPFPSVPSLSPFSPPFRSGSLNVVKRFGGSMWLFLHFISG